MEKTIDEINKSIEYSRAVMKKKSTEHIRLISAMADLVDNLNTNDAKDYNIRKDSAIINLIYILDLLEDLGLTEDTLDDYEDRVGCFVEKF